jgi:1-deoxyxylulose-5-phosphate synthase
VGVLAFSPLAGGLLTGRYDRDAGPEPGSRFAARPTYRQAYWTDAAFRTVEALERVAAATGRSLPELALGWVAAHQHVTAVLVGAERPDEVGTNARVFHEPLDDDELAAVDEAVNSPPAGGAASS